MAWRDRLRNIGRGIGDFIGRNFGGEQPGLPPLPPPGPPPGPPPEEPPEPPDDDFPEEPEEEGPEEPTGDELIEVTDPYDGSYIGTNTWDGWYESTLQKGGAYGIHTLDLIFAIMWSMDLGWEDWPWARWREDYKRRNG